MVLRMKHYVGKWSGLVRMLLLLLPDDREPDTKKREHFPSTSSLFTSLNELFRLSFHFLLSKRAAHGDLGMDLQSTRCSYSPT